MPEKKARVEGYDEQENLLASLPDTSSFGSWRMNTVTFEKDDERNFHIDFIWASANIRALSYGIRAIDRLETRIKAGNIVPAIVTTTALVTGLACLEMFKVIQKKPYEAYRNAFVNLANCIYQQSEPMPPLKHKFLTGNFTEWDKIHVEKGPNVTLGGLLHFMQTTHKLKIDSILYGPVLVYMDLMPEQKRKERIPQKLTDLLPSVSGKPIKKNQRMFALEVSGSDLQDNPIERVPVIFVWFRPRTVSKNKKCTKDKSNNQTEQKVVEG